MEYEDEFYKHILDKIVVMDKDHIDVYLHLLPVKWSYTVAKSLAGLPDDLSKSDKNSSIYSALSNGLSNNNAKRNISDTSVPISVSSPFSSG